MWRRGVAAAASVWLLTSCSAQIDISVPTNQAEQFASCVANPAVSWQLSSTRTLRSSTFITQVVKAQNVELRRAQPLTTAPPKSFRNLYAEQLVGVPLSPTIQAAKLAASEAVERVRAILTHNEQTNINNMYNGLSGTAPISAIRFNVKDFNDYISKVAQSTSLGDWTQYANHTVLLFANSASPTEVQESFNQMVMAIYIETYLKAYFRNGQFISGSIKLDTLEAAIPALRDLKEPYKTQLKNILDSLQGKLVFGKIADTGFVTRGGAAFQFPTLNVSLDVAKVQLSGSKLDYLTIGSDLIRVLLEAVFDSHDRLPAVSNATGATVAVSSRSGAGPISLPDFKKIKARPPYLQVSEKQFTSIETFANGIDASSATATGQVLRGIGWGALNNEAVAKLIEAAVGASVHKVGEKLAWCWHATVSLPTDEPLPRDVAAALVPVRNNAVPFGGVRQLAISVGY